MQWDREREKRVWQRVRGTVGNDDFAPLIRLSQAQAADLFPLDRNLYRQAQQTLTILTGLHWLSSGQETKPIRQQSGSKRERLLRCRQRCDEIMSMLVAQENHSRYGAVFTDLTRVQRAICAQLQILK